jgi:hypothetical protein
MAEEDLGATIGAYMQKSNYFVDFLRSLNNEISTTKTFVVTLLSHSHALVF